MDDSLARPLGSESGLPVEPPPPVVVARPPSHGRWAALAGFAIVSSTGILVITSLSDVQGSADQAWRDRGGLEVQVPITDGPIASSTVYAIGIDGLPTTGRADAKVTLVAVTDYSCTNCGGAREIILGLRGSYGDDLRIVWKPLTRTPASIPVSVGACAAARQGEHDRFDAAIWRSGPERAARLSQPVELPDGKRPECVSELAGCGEVVRTARDLGLDGARFEAAMKRCVPTVTAAQRELAELQIGGQAFFVNGRMVDPWGVESAGTFHSLIDVELAKARRRLAAGASPERYYQQWVLDVGHTTR